MTPSSARRRQGHAARLRHSQGGQVIVLFALALFVIFAVIGLALDGGFGLNQLREAQNAADFGSEAGTSQLIPTCDQGSVTTQSTIQSYINSVVDANMKGSPAWVANYLDSKGALLAGSTSFTDASTTPVDVPTGACGIQTTVNPTWGPFVEQILGVTGLGTTASARAILSAPTGIDSLGRYGLHTIYAGGEGEFIVDGDINDNSAGCDPLAPGDGGWSNPGDLCTSADSYGDTVDAWSQGTVAIYGNINSVDASPLDPCYSHPNAAPITPVPSYPTDPPSSLANEAIPGASATLSSALVAGTSYTSLAVTPVSGAPGSSLSGTIVINLQGTPYTQQDVTTSGAALGATTVPVTGFVASTNFPVGTPVESSYVYAGSGAVYPCGEPGASRSPVGIFYNSINASTTAITNDPLGFLPTPTSGDTICSGAGLNTVSGFQNYSGGAVLKPGVYTGPVIVTGSATFESCPGDNPGVYVFDQGLEICPQGATDVVSSGNPPGPLTGYDGGVTLYSAETFQGSYPDACPSLGVGQDGDSNTVTDPSDTDGDSPVMQMTKLDNPAATSPLWGVMQYGITVGGVPGSTVSLSAPGAGKGQWAQLLLFQDRTSGSGANIGFDAGYGDGAEVTLDGNVYDISNPAPVVAASTEACNFAPTAEGGEVVIGNGYNPTIPGQPPCQTQTASPSPPSSNCSSNCVTIEGVSVVDAFDTMGTTDLLIKPPPPPPGAGDVELVQ